MDNAIQKSFQATFYKIIHLYEKIRSFVNDNFPIKYAL